MLTTEKQEWAERHARRIQQRFEQWQKPLGIDGQEYLKYLIQELAKCCDEPLHKSLIESIS
jgi:hypothetical protein